MKNFLQVNRALVAKKKHLLFNQSFGMVGSPNQTGETLTRENRIGLMSYLRRTLMLLFAVLVMSIANIGMAWGTEYALVSNPTGTPALTTNFRYGNLTLNQSTAATIDGIGFKKAIKFGSSLSSISGKNAGDNNIMYDVKTTSTKFTVYVSGGTGTLYFSKIAEGATSTTVESKTISSNPQKIEFTLSSTTNTCVGFSLNSTSIYIYQIIAEETGTAHKQAGEAGYQLNLNKGRYSGDKLSSNSGKSGKIDNLELVHTAVAYTCTSSTSLELSKNTADTYIKFTTGTSAVNLKVTFSAGTLIVNTSKSTSGGTSLTSNTAQALAASTTYWIINTNSGNRASISKIAFEAASGVTNPSFSPATGNSLVKSIGTVTLTSSGNTVYYKWSQTNNQYASGDGATLAGAADGSGSSPVNATAPSTTGTWYLYAVAKNGSDYSDVVKATYTITNPTHTLTWNLDGGTATGGTAAGAVAEGASLTAPTVTKVGYDFAGWSPTVPATMPSSDVTYTATWTKVYASGTYQFDGNNALGTAPNRATCGTGTTSDFRIDNIFFGGATWEYDYTHSGGSGDGNNFDGWKWKTSNATIKFFVEDDSDVTIGIGSIGDGGGVTVSYTQPNGTVKSNVALAAATNNAIDAKGGTMVTITHNNSTKTVTLKKIIITSKASCTAPNHVDISGDWDKFGGETISLTATAYSSAGTGSPIADGNITGWQWQKLVGSTWTNVTNGTADGVTTSGATTKNLQISNCGQGNSGKYRCVVSTGATCSTASATATDGSEGYVVKVYALECYTGGTTVYNFTRDGNNQRGSVSIALTASTGYEFKIHADKFYGNNGTINFDENNWTFTAAGNNVTVNSGLGGTFTFTIDYSSNGDVPVLAVTYPRKRIYLSPGVWDADGAKFAYYYFHKTGDDTDAEGWTDFLTADDCGMYADIPQWNGVQMIAVRFNSSKASTGNWDDKWNQTSDLTVTSNDLITITDWNNSQTYNSTYSTPTYTIGYAKGSVPTGGGSISGSKSNETKTCGVDFTLPSSAVFTTTGYTQTGWTTSDGSSQTHALGGSYTTNADQAFYPVWTVQSYTLTWDLAGGTVTTAGTGAAKDATGTPSSSVNYGTSLTAPVVAKANYTFSAWSPTVASTMPAANTTYTATWTAKQYSVSHTLTGDHATKTSGATGSNAATYGTNYTAVFAAVSGYALPSDVTVTIGGTPATKGTEYTWNQGTGTVVITGSYITGNISITVTAEEEVSCSGDPTALVSGTLYKAQDMKSACFNSVDGDYVYGLSANGKFYITGTTNGDNSSTGTVEIKGQSKTIDAIAFDSIAWLKGSGSTTHRSIKFVTGGAGTLTVYGRTGKSAGNVQIKPSASDAVNVITASGSGSQDISGTYDVTAAGTYYILSNGSSAAVYGIKFVAAPSCTTPAAPTGFTAGSITSTGATFSITDAGNAASYDIYYSTSSDAPTASTPATTTSTSKTKAVTGLTASTTYYAWVRSVCDADHKSAWFALSGSSFTTSAAETPIITWEMKLTSGQNWELNGDPSTTDNTNITSISANNTHAAQLDGKTANGTMTAGCTTAQNGTARDNDIYVEFKFHVGCDKKLTPSKISLQVSNIGGSSDGNMTYDAILTDGTRTVSGSVTPASDGTLTTLEFTNADASKYMQGDVTLRVYPYNNNGGNSGSGFRMGQYVKIFGEIANQATPAATITWNTQPANGRVGDPDFAYDVTCSDGSTVTVTSANTTYATIVGGKLHYAAAGTTHLVASATDACGNTVTPVNSNDFTVSAAAATYSVTHSLTNVTATSGATGAGAATEGVAYNAVFSANTGYVLPSTITVTIGGSPATVGTGYTWNASTGAFQVPAAQVTGAIVITIAGETAPATKDIYYGAITITAGALTKGSTGTVQFFTNTGGTIANNTEISLSTTLGAGSEYYLSNDLTGAELSKSSNWTTSSSSNRYVQGVKFGSGKSYTLALGSKVASSITFYGINGSASKTMTIGGQAWTSSSTKNTFAKHEFTKSGNFTGNVSITQDGDFYGILVITIQTATPCTTPVIPALSNQSLCEGTDIAEWDATQTAVLADGETASYSWKKKGNDTEIEDEATLDLGAATESMAGTYVVTVTVSKAGKASATATKEVTLTVTAAVEEPVITANKATVYPGNSVTLTATCGTDGVTWNWYSCANADGTGAGSSLGTSSSYTIASAGAAGTYYYKAVATGSCGTAEAVYTLTVTAASECEKYFWFVYAADATSNGVVNNRDGFFTGAPTGSSNSSTYKFTLDGTEYTATKNTGSGSFSISFTIPEGSTATMGINCKGSSSKPLYLTHSSGTPQKLVSNSSSNASCTVEDITEGTWTLTSAGSWTLAALGVQVCTTSTCTDATPTITAVNNTVCSGTKMRIDATGYEAGATFKWQKLNTSTSSWDDVAGATLDSLVIASVTASNAGSYRFIATKGCSRTSNTVTITVPSAPNFGSTVPASVSVMQTIALSINTVEATDAVKYKWYKSANATWDAGDTEIGTNKELIKAYDGEATGSPSYYIFCRAQNACGITTSSAIAVNVTAYVEEDCATRGNEGDAEFGFEYSAGQATYSSTACWSMNDNSKKLIYAAPEGKYFKTMKVTIASSSASKASYNWSTNGGTSFTEVAINSINTTLTEKTIDVSAHGYVNALQIGRNLDGKGESSGTLYVSKICFEYTDACTATTVTPSTSSVNYEMGGAWSNPTFTLSVAGTLTYSSSNEDIASVDDDGTVTFNGEAGTVTITASYAGGTISATDYCASSGSYTINVSCPGGAPKVVADGSVDMSGCNSSVTLLAKTQSDGDFADGTYQWFRNGEEIDGATSSSYTATQAGTYTVERTNTSDCTTPSTNSAIVTSTATEPEVERLVPFQYYHVDKTYSDQMKMRHLFAVKNSGKLDGKSFKMYVSRNGAAATDVTSSNALVVWPNGDGHVDTVMVDLNKLSGKYSEDDELVFTCKAIDCSGNVSDVYKETITMNVIGATPTLALICSGSSKAGGTRKTGELTVGGDFLTGYNVADLCQQTGNTSFDGNTEWGLYTDLKTQYIVTPVNGYAVFNKLNYEPFDILLLTDYPKASKSDAAATILDDMAALCDYRPMLSFKTHMVAKSPSKWAAKGFTTSPVVTKADGRLNLNIVCYAHPMFEGLKTGDDVYNDVGNTSAPLVYTMLTGTGFESSKGMQGFELAAAENFVTIGLTHYNGTITKDSPLEGQVSWASGSEDRMLVTVAERQANPEARFILFSLNCGAQSKLTDKGEEVILACLNYLLGTAEGAIAPADCSFTFDNGEGNKRTPEEQAINCPSCPSAGDHKWNNPANWGPDYRLLPGEFTSVRIKKPVEVDDEHAHVMEVRIIDEGSIDIPAGKALDVKSTIRRMDGSEIYPTEENDIHIGSASTGNGTLIFNNNDGDTKARVDMYSNAQADMVNMSAATSTWQYIGTPHSDVASATHNYYDSWIYQYSGSGWEVIPNGGPLVPFRGYCVTHPDAPVVFSMEGTLVATTAQDIAIPAGYTVIANSWVAPIDINVITDDDMENISDKTIYFFNTGSDADGNHGTGTEAGTYRATPIHSASYTGDWQIPSMQGFYVYTTSAGTFHLDYERHVRPADSRSVVSNPMYAPRRAAAESDEPNVLKIFARGSRYQDKLVVLEREDFTRGYDSGWDGEAWGGGTLSPMVYVIGEGREDAVSAIPEFEGTVVAFKAGEDSEYRFEFIYDGDESLYLFDTENNTYTQVMTGNAYYFTTTDKAAHSRFILTRKNPQVATGIEPTSGSLDRSKAKKLLIEDKMFIIVNGMLYDATGKVVK